MNMATFLPPDHASFARYKNAAAFVALTLVCFMSGALAVRAPLSALVLIGAVGCLVIWLTGPHWMAFIALTVSFTAVPAAVPAGKVIGDVGIFVHEILLLLAIAFLIPFIRGRTSIFALPVGFVMLVVVPAVATGLVRGNEFRMIVWEARPLLMIAAGFLLSILLINFGFLRQAIKLTGLILWFSAIMVMIGSSTGLQIRGRNESLVDVTGRLVGGVERLVTWTQIPALAVLIVILVLSIISRVGPRLLLGLALPAAIITVLGFSRSALVALAFAAAAAVLVNYRQLSLYRLTRYLLAGAALILLLILTFQLLKTFGIGGWIADQFGAFSRRVLGGLTIGADRDLSWQFRVNENDNLWRAMHDSRVLGNGLGHAYQNPYGPVGSWTRTYGPYYSHNFYYWLVAKAGLVGLAGFLWFALLPIARGFRAPAVGAKVGAIVALSILVISYVWPIPEGVPDSIVLGIALGAAMAFSRQDTGGCPRSDWRRQVGVRGGPARERLVYGGPPVNVAP